MNSISTNKKKKFAYSVIAFVVLCYAFVIAPLRSQHADLESEFVKKSEEVKKYNKQTAEIERAMNATSKLYVEWQGEVKVLAREGQLMPNVQEEVAKRAAAAKLNVASIQTMPDVKTRDITVGILKISADGSYAQILRFIDTITNANRLLRIVDFSLGKITESEDKVKAKNGALKINLTLEFYR